MGPGKYIKQKLAPRDSGISNDSIQSHISNLSRPSLKLLPTVTPITCNSNKTKIFYNRNGSRIDGKRASQKQVLSQQNSIGVDYKIHQGIPTGLPMGLTPTGVAQIGHMSSIYAQQQQSQRQLSPKNNSSNNNKIFGHQPLSQAYSIGSLRDQPIDENSLIKNFPQNNKGSSNTINSLKEPQQQQHHQKEKLSNKISGDSVMTNSTVCEISSSDSINDKIGAFGFLK